jgi:hypothetical protein
VAEEVHRELMASAIARDGEAQRALLAGDLTAARAAFAAASGLYRRSWEAAPPTSYGRLVGLLKSAVLAGEGRDQADYVRAVLGEQVGDSPTVAYASAIAALIVGDDAGAELWAARMRGGSDAFDRTADAIAGLAAGDPAAFAVAIEAIVRDFESRADHLTGVAIADTAVMLELLAERRGISADVDSPLLPALQS